MLRNFTPRLYQQTILGTVAQYNTLVVLADRYWEKLR